MKGLELSEKFYEEYGKPMLESEFADILPYIAVGLVGSGSERYGFDDEISRDHDFEAGFGIFLPSEDLVDRRKEFLLERAYNKLPKEFMGVKRPLISPVGGSRNGPIRTSEFYRLKAGTSDGNLSDIEWLTIPDYALFEATDGKVFYDGLGEFTAIRKKLSNPPEDVILKRIAGNLLLMAKAGQYNYARCLKRGERESASFCVNEFVNSAVKVALLLKGKFAPYYKWSFRYLRETGENELADKLSKILLEPLSENKQDEIEEIATMFISRLIDKNLTNAVCGDLEKHAYSVNDKITDGNIRNMDIFVSV